MLIKNLTFAAAVVLTTAASGATPAPVNTQAAQSNSSQVTYHTKDIGGVNVFYREAGPKDAPTVEGR
jgi:hypothetical protein